jgi:hypothetical protein
MSDSTRDAPPIAVGVVRAIALFALLATGLDLSAKPILSPYGAKVRFRAGSRLHFSDFDLTFLRLRRNQPPPFPPGILVYEFRVVKDNEVMAVSWSAGTGVVAPSSFTMSGQRFLLELGFSERIGVLKDNELVVTKVANAP